MVTIVLCVFQRDDRILALRLGRASIRILCRLPPPTTIYEKLTLSEEVSLGTSRTFLGKPFLQNLITNGRFEVLY